MIDDMWESTDKMCMISVVFCSRLKWKDVKGFGVDIWEITVWFKEMFGGERNFLGWKGDGDFFGEMWIKSFYVWLWKKFLMW